MRVSRCRIFINGPEMTDFKSYKANERKLAEVVKLMNESDTVDVNPELGFTFDYVPKAGVAEYDFESELNGTGTVRVVKKGGGATVWTECKLLSIGEESLDGEKEMVKTIGVFAKKRSEE